MATILVKDGNSADKYIEVDGTGTAEDPYRLKGTNAAAVLTALQAIQTATEALDDTVLPTGAATATLQTAGNSTLTTIDGHVDGLEASAASIDTKTPALGQALAAASVPVVLTEAQQTALTPPAAITGFATQTTLASVDTKIGEVQASPTANTVLDRLKAIATALGSALSVTQSGTWTVQPGNTANTTAWKVDGSATAQPVTDNNASLTIDSTQLPAALGGTTASASLPVTLASDGTFATLIGAVNETAPANDTANSGLNGRLQRIAQNITTLFGRFVAAATLADSTALPSTTTVGAAPLLYNGATLDLQRANLDGVALPSAARTATTSSADITNYNHRGVLVTINITAASGTGGLQVRIEPKDVQSGLYIAINAAPTVLTANQQAIYGLYPGLVNGNLNRATGLPLSRVFRIRVIHADSSSYTYSVSYSLIN